MISTLTDSNGNLLSVSDKVRDEEGLTWFVLSMFPEINSVVGITTNEDRFDRKAFRPEELEIIWWHIVMSVGISMRPTERTWGTQKNQITVSKIINPIVIIIGTHLWKRITIGEMHFPTWIACVTFASILPTKKKRSPGNKKSSRLGTPGFLAQGTSRPSFFRLELDHEIHRPIHDPSHVVSTRSHDGHLHRNRITGSPTLWRSRIWHTLGHCYWSRTSNYLRIIKNPHFWGFLFFYSFSSGIIFTGT